MEYGKKIVTVVPMHEEVKLGTLLGILKLAKIRREEFLQKLLKYSDYVCF